MVVKDLEVEMYAMNHKVMEFTVADLDTDPTGATPLSLAGLDIKWAATATDPDGNYLVDPLVISRILGTGITVIDSLNGVLQVEILSAETTNELAGAYYFELEVFDASLEAVVVATGTLTILRNVENN